MFTRAIVREPCGNMVKGITTADLGAPDHQKAVEQHGAYVQALRRCGLEVTVLPADDEYPDSTFVEDTALLTPRCAVITNPGADSRRGEIGAMRPVVQRFFSVVEEIVPPGTVEGGDIMMVGDHYYIGLSDRTNESGAQQMIDILRGHGMSGSTIELERVLHLKTGLAYLENDNLVACGEFLSRPEFRRFTTLEIPAAESYAANCVWVNGKVLIPAGYPESRRVISAAGYDVVEVELSEFRKLDGGLSCLSLRF